MITLKYKKGQELNKMLILRDIMQYIPDEQFETINKSNSIIPETKMIVKNDCIISFEIKFLSNERKSVRKHECTQKKCDSCKEYDRGIKDGKIIAEHGTTNWIT